MSQVNICQGIITTNNNNKQNHNTSQNTVFNKKLERNKQNYKTLKNEIQKPQIQNSYIKTFFQKGVGNKEKLGNVQFSKLSEINPKKQTVFYINLHHFPWDNNQFQNDNGIQSQFIIDSGADVSLMNAETFCAIWKVQPD